MLIFGGGGGGGHLLSELYDNHLLSNFFLHFHGLIICLMSS